VYDVVVKSSRSLSHLLMSFLSHVVFGTKSCVNTGRPSTIFAYWQIVQLCNCFLINQNKTGDAISSPVIVPNSTFPRISLNKQLNSS